MEKIEQGKTMDDQEDDSMAWSTSMMEKGYVRGPHFETYEELSNWDKQNKRPHVRRRTQSGFLIFFTDRLNENNPPPDQKGENELTTWPIDEDDKIPF